MRSLLPGPEAGSGPDRKIRTDQWNILIHQQYKNLQRWREQKQTSAKRTETKNHKVHRRPGPTPPSAAETGVSSDPGPDPGPDPDLAGFVQNERA